MRHPTGQPARQPTRHSRHSRHSRILLPAVLAAALIATACGTGQDEPSGPLPPRPEGPDLMWSGDLETGDLSQFKDTPWNVTRGGSEPEIVSDPQFVREGRYAVKISIPTGETDDKDGACCDPRAEIEPNISDIRDGDDLWFGFSTMLASDFPVNDEWQVITQWKSRVDGSPPVSLNVERGAYLLAGGAGHPDEEQPFVKELAPAVPGQWSDWVVHIAFSPDPRKGYVEVWQNGTPVLERYSPPGGTMYPAEKGEDAESYLKTGYYRNGDITAPGVVYFDSWRVGRTRDAVALT
ncbi:MAG: polysaccharide lyase [Pseudonocardia sp.]